MIDTRQGKSALAARCRALGQVVLLLAVAVSAAHGAVSEPYTTEFYQSPVKGDPDDLLTIGGNFSGSAQRTVVYHRVENTASPPPTPTSVPTYSTSVTGVAELVKETADSLVVHLPSVMIRDQTYMLWIQTDAIWGSGFLINDARPLWITPRTAYATGMPGDLPRELKVVGRNLQPAFGETTRVRIRDGLQVHTLDADLEADPRSEYAQLVARVELPATLATGSYIVEVSRDGESWKALPTGENLTVIGDPVLGTPRNISDYLDENQDPCAPNDGVDDTECVRQAIADADTMGGYVSFGNGAWDVTGSGSGGEIDVPIGVSLIGVDPSVTFVRIESTSRLFVLHGRNTVSGIHFERVCASACDPALNECCWQGTPSPCQPTNYSCGPENWSALRLGPQPNVLDESEWPTGEQITDIIISNNRFHHMPLAIDDGGFSLLDVIIAGNVFNAFRDNIFLHGNYHTDDKVHFKVERTVISGNEFIPSTYLKIPDAQVFRMGEGTIGSQLGTSSYLDFSDNTAYGDQNGGWRAAFFWHMTNSTEATLVSRNIATCTGDKAGDGEFLSFDSAGNEPAWVQTVVGVDAATLTTVDVTVDWIEDLSAQGHPDYYENTNGYWIHVVDGKGLGQVRRVISYVGNPSTSPSILTVSPRWDVIPDTTSRVYVAKLYWQLYVVDNEVDIRGCEKDNLWHHTSGRLLLHGNTIDSIVSGNRQYESDGIFLRGVFGEYASCGTCPPCPDPPCSGDLGVPVCYQDGDQFQCSAGKTVNWLCDGDPIPELPTLSCVSGDPKPKSNLVFQYFNEVRENLIDGEYDFWACQDGTSVVGTNCEGQCCPGSWSGIQYEYGSCNRGIGCDTVNPVVSHGVSIAHNRIDKADGLRGGAISTALVSNAVDGADCVDINSDMEEECRFFQTLSIFHNEISNVSRFNNPACYPPEPDQKTPGEWDGGVGIQLQQQPIGAENIVFDTVLYHNAIETTCHPIVDDGGYNTTYVEVVAAPPTCPTEVACCDATLPGTIVEVDQGDQVCLRDAANPETVLTCPDGETVHTRTQSCELAGGGCPTTQTELVCLPPVTSLPLCGGVEVECHDNCTVGTCDDEDLTFSMCEKEPYGTILSCPESETVHRLECDCDGRSCPAPTNDDHWFCQ